MNRNRQTGVSLIELMIGITIGLFLLIGVISVFSNSNRVYSELNQASQQIENGRFALQIMADDVGHAGFYGRYYGSLTAPGTLPDPCDLTVANFRAATAYPIQGYNAPGSSPITGCVAAANHLAGTDIVVVRRADSTATLVGALDANEVYSQANADPNQSLNPIIALGVAANFTLFNKDATTLAPIRKYHVHIYFVSPCSVPAGGGTVCTGAADDGGSPIPTLKRLELKKVGGALGWEITPLVEGIENLQVDYGIDTDGDGAPNGAYVTVPTTVPDWQNVVAVRLNVLARNLQRTGDTDTKQYDMGVAGLITPGDNYKRHVYNAVVRVVNPSARRDS
jgi:type IV pilus assembly protein PilW